MQRFVTIAWWIFAALLTVVGFVLTLPRQGGAFLALQLALMAVGVTTIFFAGRRLIEWFMIATRRYPYLLIQTADAQDRANRLSAELAASLARQREAFDAGISEGVLRVTGPLLASRAPPPEITGLAGSKARVELVARPLGQPQVGARYALEIEHSGDTKGIVQVVRVEGGTLRLVVVHDRSPEYWLRLGERVEADPSKPDGARLKHIPAADPIPDWTPPVISAPEPEAPVVDD